MIGVLKKIWRFAGKEQANIGKSIFWGFFYAVFHMLQVAAIYFVVLALTGGEQTSRAAWLSLLLLAVRLLFLLLPDGGRGHLLGRVGGRKPSPGLAPGQQQRASQHQRAISPLFHPILPLSSFTKAARARKDNQIQCPPPACCPAPTGGSRW